MIPSPEEKTSSGQLQGFGSLSCWKIHFCLLNDFKPRSMFTLSQVKTFSFVFFFFLILNVKSVTSCVFQSVIPNCTCNKWPLLTIHVQDEMGLKWIIKYRPGGFLAKKAAIKVHLLLQFSLHHMANWKATRSCPAPRECWNDEHVCDKRLSLLICTLRPNQWKLKWKVWFAFNRTECQAYGISAKKKTKKNKTTWYYSLSKWYS